jgi:hypothetical protein
VPARCGRGRRPLGGVDPVGAGAGRLSGAVGQPAVDRAGPGRRKLAAGCAMATSGPPPRRCWRCRTRWRGAGAALGTGVAASSPSSVPCTRCSGAGAGKARSPSATSVRTGLGLTSTGLTVRGTTKIPHPGHSSGAEPGVVHHRGARGAGRHRLPPPHRSSPRTGHTG